MLDMNYIVKNGETPCVVCETIGKSSIQQTFPDDCIQFVRREFEGGNYFLDPDGNTMAAGYENIIDNAEAVEFLKQLMEHPFYQQFFETYHSGTLVTEIPLNVSWFGTPEDGRKIRHYYDFEHKCYSKIVYQQNSSIMESIEITTFNGRHEKLEYGIGTIKVEEADNPFLTEEVGKNLMYADMKDSGYEKVILMLASMLMQMHGIDKSTRKPLDLAELIDGVEMPEDIYEAVHAFNVPESKEKEAIAHLCYDAMKHIDDDIRDLYACHVKTPHGVKGFTYHNTHPHLHEIQTMDKDFVQFCLDNLKGENEENEIVDYIAAKVAEYILGEDFRLFFDENINYMPEHMMNAFLKDAERIYKEMQTSKK